MIIKVLLMAVGICSVVLGVIGIFLPVLPTTPFLLLAAACFARSSLRFHGWLMGHRWFGPYLRYYTEGLGIPRAVKLRAIGVMWLGMGVSVIFFVPWIWLKIVLLLVALAVSLYIWTRPTAVVVNGDGTDAQ